MAEGDHSSGALISQEALTTMRLSLSRWTSLLVGKCMWPQMLLKFVRCVSVCCILGSGDRSERYWVYFAHLCSIMKHGVAISHPAVVTVRSDAGFERAATMEVVNAHVCGCDGHPTSSTGMLEPCAE